ncbi:MAG TPA: hypothetical protein PLJ97_01955 [Candidatus Saccharibacteria bacterium]|jgi:thiol:disulfide interchange protein|nr:hypothetical protein [Candidatus Saccharibacteria bacterium]
MFSRTMLAVIQYNFSWPFLISIGVAGFFTWRLFVNWRRTQRSRAIVCGVIAILAFLALVAFVAAGALVSFSNTTSSST